MFDHWMDEIWCMSLASKTGVIIKFFEWEVPNIFLHKTFGTNVAINWCLKLGLAQRSSQLGSTTCPKSITKLYWLIIRVAKNTFPMAMPKNSVI
jgi:hypothetical protein